MLDVSIEGAQPIIDRLEDWDERFAQYARANLQTLGGVIAYVERSKMRPKKYTGAMERSVSITIDVKPWAAELRVGPTAKHSIFVRLGTRPHWAPIAPLIRWAQWKLGTPIQGRPYVASATDATRAAYAVQRAIAMRGIKAFDFVQMTLDDGRVQTGVRNTARRLGVDLAAYIAGEK